MSAKEISRKFNEILIKAIDNLANTGLFVVEKPLYEM